MTKPKVSIIIPIYNMEKFVGRCLDSFVNQTFKDFEVVIIDDGSTDRSPVICDMYADKDNRFHVYHIPNGGVARARQYGVDKACGIYSIHADADDWVEKDMLQQMVIQMDEDELDMLIADFFVDGEAKTSYKAQIFPPLSLHTESETKNAHVELIDAILRGKLFGGLWHKMIRHELYSRYDIHFEPDINYCEDVLVVSQMLLHNIKVGHHPHAYYHYDTQCQESITRTLSRKTYDNQIRFIKKLSEILPPSLSDAVLCNRIKTQLSAYKNRLITRDEYKRETPYGLSTLLRCKLRNGNLIIAILNDWGYYGISDGIIGIRNKLMSL